MIPSRLLLAPVCLLLVWLPLAAAESAPANSPSVAAVDHSPHAPERGHDVQVHLVTEPGAAVDRVVLNYCTVETRYCAAPMVMTRTDADDWAATIPWSKPSENRFAEFWDGVTEVGYRFTIRHANGTTEASPLQNYPDTPPDYDLEAHYYFYRLQGNAPPSAAKGVPGLDVVAAAAAFGVAVLALVRRP